MGKFIRFVATAIAILLVGVPAARADVIQRISVGNAGEQADLDSSGGVLSADGRWVAFSTTANGLVPDDFVNRRDVFVRDTLNGVTERISVHAGSGAAGGKDPLAISADGRFVAYESMPYQLNEFFSIGSTEFWVRDRDAGTTDELTSDSPQGLGVGVWDMSPDGRYVVFSSVNDGLVGGDTNGVSDVFVSDRTTDTIERVSIATGGGQADDLSSVSAISPDGRYVVFSSRATNLVAGDTNALRDGFLRDRVTGVTERVSVSDGESEGNGASSGVSLSSDGRYVAFASQSTNLVPMDTNAKSDIFVRDRLLGTTQRVSLGDGGAESNGVSFDSKITPDGRYIVFTSTATNLVPGDTNEASDVFVRDLLLGSNKRVSVNQLGQEGDGPSGSADISPDGRTVTFESDATNLVPGDSNEAGDVFAAAVCDGVVCGDGVTVPVCERCDDGNTVSGDGCGSDCMNQCGNSITTADEECDVGGDEPGDYCTASCSLDLDRLAPGGKSSGDCMLEWSIPPATVLDSKGFPEMKITCRDDDPTCDFGATTGDKACTFRVGLCFNVSDDRFLAQGGTGCTPTQIASFVIKKPKISEKSDVADIANRAALMNTLGEIRELSFRCIKPKFNKDASCLVNADCDDAGGDGECGPSVVDVYPSLTRQECTDYMDIVVPLKGSAAGKRQIQLAAADSQGLDDERPVFDKDSLKLSCTP